MLHPLFLDGCYRRPSSPSDCFCLLQTERFRLHRFKGPVPKRLWWGCVDRVPVMRTQHLWVWLYGLVDVGPVKATGGAGEDEKGGETTEDRWGEAGRTAPSHLMKSWRLFPFSFIRSRLCFSFPLYCGTRSTLILKFKYMDFYLCISILVWMSVVYECVWWNRGIRTCTLM